MPLPAPAPRRKIHQRQVICDGFEREDGLWDIEARMTDVKSYDMANRDRGGQIPAGEPLHDMSLRLTIDLEYRIHAVEAVIDYAPFNVCPRITGAFGQLVGKQIGPGWTRLSRQLFSGTRGCTHMMELLGPLATTAFQSTQGARVMRSPSNERPPMIDTCHALAADGEVTRDFWPEHYQPPEKS